MKHLMIYELSQKARYKRCAFFFHFSSLPIKPENAYSEFRKPTIQTNGILTKMILDNSLFRDYHELITGYNQL